MSATLHLGDCLGFLKAMPDKSVDVLITDPPYGIAITRKSNNFGVRTDAARQASGEAWDDARPDAEYFAEMLRVSRRQIIFGGNYFMEFLPSTRCFIVWDKRGDLPEVPFAPVEWAWTSFDRQPVRYVVRNHGFIRDSREPREHPTQKPLLLLDRIVADFTAPTDTILDCYMGSGTTGVAATKAGRAFVGIERKPDYFAIAERRIGEAQPQLLEV